MVAKRTRKGRVVAEAPSGAYCADADTLINLRDHRPELFPRIRKLAQRGALRLAGGVYREIQQRTDKLRRSVEQWQRKYQVVAEVAPDTQAGEWLSVIERQYGEEIVVRSRRYPGFWKSRRGRRSADGQVVALAKANGWIVVSNDRAVSLVSMLEGVPCITWQEFARQLEFGSRPGQFTLPLQGLAESPKAKPSERGG